MAERKPPGVSWEKFIDRQIREASERGEFEDLPGTGKPIAELGKPSDATWWVKGKLRSEGLTYMPPSLALRRDAQDALDAAMRARSEDEARRIVETVNEQIREANRKGIAGPPVMLRPIDVDAVLEEWRRKQRPLRPRPEAARRERGPDEPGGPACPTAPTVPRSR